MHVRFSFDVIVLEFWILQLNKGLIGDQFMRNGIDWTTPWRGRAIRDRTTLQTGYKYQMRYRVDQPGTGDCLTGIVHVQIQLPWQLHYQLVATPRTGLSGMKSRRVIIPGCWACRTISDGLDRPVSSERLDEQCSRQLDRSICRVG